MDGSIVNGLRKKDGTITYDMKDISKTLIEALKSIQLSDNFETYLEKVHFPELPPLSLEEMNKIIDKLSSGKATSYDLFSDLCLNDEILKSLFKEKLISLWTSQLNDIRGIEEFFKVRLVPLNKIHPEIPTDSQFRPNIIMSIIIKLMEARWLPKLQEHLIQRLAPSQTEFVP